jgi:RNA polymerase sigma factor (sigma-70 family)
MEAERDSEVDLVAKLRRCEASAFDVLYTRYNARIHAFLLRLSGRRDVAEDLFQETWLNASRAAPRLHEETRLAAWLFTIARNQWVSHRRWAMLDLSRLVTIGDESPYAARGPGPDEELAAAESAAGLERAIGALPAPLREAILIVAVEGFDQKEAAAILGIRHDLLRQRVTRGREKIAHLLGELAGEGGRAHPMEAAKARNTR